jgi:hypothetical protein
MRATELFKLKSELTQEGVIFLYCGYMTENVLEGIGAALRTKLALDQTERRIAKSLFSIFVEQVQNVVRYSAEREFKNNEEQKPELRYGILSIGRDRTGYFVACGNAIHEGDVGRVRSGLEEIQQLDHDQLMALYMQTLKGSVPEGSKGAGVGLLDIARLATGGLTFDFTAIDNGLSFFTIKAHL